MRKLYLFAIIVFAFLFSTAGENKFEGNLTFTSLKNGSSTGKLELAVKNDMLALNPGNAQQMVLNATTGDFFTVIKQGDQKMVVKVNLAVLGDLNELPDFFGPFSSYFGTDGRGDAPEVKLTDETKTINGFKSKKYVVKDKENTTTVWVTKDIPFNFQPLLDMLKMGSDVDAGLKSAFPLEGTVKSATGETSSFKVAVEKKVVDEKLFELPTDLMVMDMTPLVKEMIQKNDHKQIKQMLDQFIPR